MNKLKIVLLISVLLILTGCEKYFFFPKQQLFYLCIYYNRSDAITQCYFIATGCAIISNSAFDIYILYYYSIQMIFIITAKRSVFFSFPPDSRQCRHSDVRFSRRHSAIDLSKSSAKQIPQFLISQFSFLIFRLTSGKPCVIINSIVKN